MTGAAVDRPGIVGVPVPDDFAQVQSRQNVRISFA
jgi:hypothetical protein